MREVIDAKRRMLEKYGLQLAQNQVLEVIQGQDRHFYELKTGSFRIATYWDGENRVFVLFNGWIKKGRRHPRDIAQARRLLHEYLQRR